MNKNNTLRWFNGALEMLDQRVLPSRISYLRFDSAAAVAEGIKAMVVRGAPAIGLHYASALAGANRGEEARAILRQILQDQTQFQERAAAQSLLDSLGSG